MSKKNIVVLGLDSFGMSTIKQLSKYNCEILAIDKNIDKVEDANEYATYAMQLNMQDADDFEELSSMCKYRGCLHDKEPSCAVKEAVENGTISKDRYEHYLMFLKEVKELKERMYG